MLYPRIRSVLAFILVSTQGPGLSAQDRDPAVAERQRIDNLVRTIKLLQEEVDELKSRAAQPRSMEVLPNPESLPAPRFSPSDPTYSQDSVIEGQFIPMEPPANSVTLPLDSPLIEQPFPGEAIAPNTLPPSPYHYPPYPNLYPPPPARAYYNPPPIPQVGPYGNPYGGPYGNGPYGNGPYGGEFGGRYGPPVDVVGAAQLWLGNVGIEFQRPFRQGGYGPSIGFYYNKSFGDGYRHGGHGGHYKGHNHGGQKKKGKKH